jgi:hypothetical protein
MEVSVIAISPTRGRMRWKCLYALTLILLFAGQMRAQSSDEATPSLGDAAKKNKEAPKSKAKRVFTDEDAPARTNPIPVIALQGADNIDEILSAIHEFKRTHTPAETEQVVHEWFDEQSEVLAGAIDANNRIAQTNQLKMEVAQDGYQYPQNDPDYQKIQQRNITERRSQRIDARSNRDNWLVIGRIQQAFLRVRCDVVWNRGKTAYDWFRIRNANGVGSY